MENMTNTNATVNEVVEVKEIKMTRKSVLNAVVEFLSNEENIIPGLDDKDKATEVLKKMIASLDKKPTSSKPTKTQIENKDIKADIVKALTEIGKPVTIKELQSREEFSEYSTSKMSALLGQLWNKGEGEIVKSYDKRVAYFGLK